MNNTKIYENNCKNDVINNIQITKKHPEYSIGQSIYATSDKGNRLHQEDSVIIHVHPKDKDIKLIAITDGVTDCLSTKQIENIIKNSKEEEITNNIVKNALILNSLLIKEIKQLPKEKQKEIIEMPEILEEDYIKEIKGGMDNATAAIYIRK